MVDDREARIRAAADEVYEATDIQQVYPVLDDLLTEAEDRGKWVECPECHGSELEGCGHDCGTCKDGTGRIRRELKGALWMDDEYHGKHGRRYLSGINQGGRTARDVAREKWGER